MSHHKQTDLMVPNSIWEGVSQEFLDFCRAHGRTRNYTPKQYLYFSGDEANTAFFLLKGRIQLLLTGEFNEKIYRVLHPPAFFPEVIFDGKAYPHAALAIEATEVLAIDRVTLLRYIESNPHLLWSFYHAMSLDLRRAYRQIKNLSLGDARLRLGAKLFALAHAHGKPSSGGTTIGIPLSATELAGMCSLARESVSRILGELRESKLIEVERKTITIIDLDGLRTWIRDRAGT